MKVETGMTFAALLADLGAFDPHAPLVFKTGDREIGAGYHVTELRHTTSTGIDCGGTIETFEDARLQLLDGTGGTHMTVGKFSGIVSGSLRKLPALADLPLLAEFSPDNDGLRLLALGKPALDDGRVMIGLGGAGAVCKPMQRSTKTVTPDTGCYSGSVSTSACCG